MIKQKIFKNSKLNTLFLIITLSSILSLILTAVNAQAAPIGPSVTILANQTKATAASTKVNTTINGTISPGGYIFTTALTSVQQNTRWKGYVGNVTGTLVLDDANDNRLFSWALSTALAGEVYATRTSGNVNWTGINCTWIKEGSLRYNESNRSAEASENAALSQTNKDDNITATFSKANHTSITTGSVVIGKNECFAVQPYQKSAAQVFADSANANFTEVILYDGAFNTTNGNVIYESRIDNDVTGYRSDSTYDFQMILPESGAVGFSSSTAYYFYVELT